MIRRLTGSGVIYRFFILGNKQSGRKMESGRYPRWAQPTWHAWLGVPGLPGAPWCLVPTRGAFLVVSYFPIFCYIPKRTKNIFADFSESVYLPYHIPPFFHYSGVFRKVSFMCSSGVKVWITLLSTLIIVPEI